MVGKQVASLKTHLTEWSRSLALVKCGAVVNTNTDGNLNEKSLQLFWKSWKLLI